MLEKDALEEVKKLTPEEIDRLKSQCQDVMQYFDQVGEEEPIVEIDPRVISQLLAEVERLRIDKERMDAMEMDPAETAALFSLIEFDDRGDYRVDTNTYKSLRELLDGELMPLPAPPLTSGGSNAKA